MAKKNEEVEKTLEVNLMDNLIMKIQGKQARLEQIEITIETVKTEKKEVVDEVKMLLKDLAHFMKYLNPEQQEHIKSLGLDVQEDASSNIVCKIVLDIMMKDKKPISNEKLHHAYLDSLDEGKEGVNYTAFNIALRPLLSKQLLKKKIVDDGGSSRTNIISLNENNKEK